MTRRTRPMRPYRASDLPVTCADCGAPVRLTRYGWGHCEPRRATQTHPRHRARVLGRGHAPHVAGTVQP